MLIAVALVADSLAGAEDDLVPARFDERAILGIAASCPPLVTSGTAIDIPVGLRNRAAEPITVTRGAVAVHQGRTTLSGPNAFAVSTAMQGAGSGTDAARADTTVTVRMPPGMRHGTMATVVLAFLGRVGDGPKRRLLGSATCHIEVTATPGIVVLTSIEVAPASATLALGASQPLVARGRFSDGTTQQPLVGVNWSSDATGVATVDTSGLASASAPGLRAFARHGTASSRRLRS